jgi:hypothetical protein
MKIERISLIWGLSDRFEVKNVRDLWIHFENYDCVMRL